MTDDSGQIGILGALWQYKWMSAAIVVVTVLLSLGAALLSMDFTAESVRAWTSFAVSERYAAAAAPASFTASLPVSAWAVMTIVLEVLDGLAEMSRRRAVMSSLPSSFATVPSTASLVMYPARCAV